MGNETSSTDKTSSAGDVTAKTENSKENLYEVPSLERENHYKIVIDKNIEVDTLANKNKLLLENYELRTEKLHLIQSKDEMSKKCEQLEKYNKTLKSEIVEHKFVSDTLIKANHKLLREISTLKNEKLHVAQSEIELSKKCEQLEIYNKAFKNEMLKYKHLSDTYMKANDKLLCEISVLENEELHLSRSKDEIKNKYEQLEKYNETLKIEYKSVSDTLTKKLINETLRLTESKHKNEELKKRNETIKSELAKYESVPMLKQIIDLFEKLQVFLQDIKRTETNILIEEQIMKSIAEISNKKKENNKLEDKVIRKPLNLHQITQLTEAKEQIIQAEKTLETINLNFRSFLDYKLQEVSSVTQSVKMCMEEFDKILDDINKNEEQLLEHRNKIFVVLQNKGDQIKRKEQEECEKILTLLDKQYNVLCNLLYLAEPSQSHLKKNLSLDDSADENLSEISESDSVLLSTGGKKRYAVMLYNLIEGPDDQQKVIDIIRSICSISTKKIEVQRLGGYTKKKKRPIKVYVPNFISMSQILSKKWKLETGEYQHIKIAPFNKKRGKKNGKQVQNEKSATFAYSN